MNRSLECYLRCFAGDHPQTWFRFLHLAKYWYNTAFHTAIGMSPFQALYGRPPPSLFEYTEGIATSDSINTVVEERFRSKKDSLSGYVFGPIDNSRFSNARSTSFPNGTSAPSKSTAVSAPSLMSLSCQQRAACILFSTCLSFDLTGATKVMGVE